MAKILISDSTINTLMDELQKDIECQILKQLQAASFFLIQCFETTDIARLSQLIVYVRFNWKKYGVLQTHRYHSRAEDVFKLSPCLLQPLYTLEKKSVAVCTDDGLTMCRSRSEFIAKIRKTPIAVKSHSVIHGKRSKLQNFTYCHER